MKRGPSCYDPLCEKHNPKSMNYCNCPNCRTDNCPNAESYATKAEHENDVFVIGDIIRLRKENSVLLSAERGFALEREEHQRTINEVTQLESALAAQREEIEKLRAALMKIGECAGRNILVEAPYGNQVRLDEALQQIHDAALSALTKPQPSQT